MKTNFFRFLLLCLCYVSGTTAHAVNLEEYMKNHVLIWEQLPMQWNEGAFVGNGLTGMMVYVDSISNTVVFHLGRPDVTDHRKAPDRKTSMGVTGATRILDYCRLDVGKMLLYPKGKILSGTFYLDIYNGELTGNLTTDKGNLTFCAYTPNDKEVNIVEVSSSLPYFWKGISGSARSPRVHVFPELKEKAGYVDNPKPIVTESSKEGSWVQPLLAGGDYATYWKEVQDNKSRSVLYVSTANEVPASDVSLAKATATVKAAYTATHAALRKEMRNWWNKFHQHSFISIPDKKLENFYFIQMYKLGTCSHPKGVAMDLFGPFYKLSPWPSYWWNLNIQLTYMPVYPANRLEQGVNYQRLLDEFLSPLVEATSPYKMGDFAWALQNYYLYLRYSGTDWKEIKLQFTPKALDVLRAFEKVMERKGDIYHLIQVESPEYEGTKLYDNSHYGLASLRWLLETLILCHDKTTSTHPEYAYWQEVLAHLHSYPINENGMMIAPDVPLAKSHRHYSHLLAFYPLRLLTPDVPANRGILEKSIDHWISIDDGKELTGYSYTGAASLYAYLGDGRKAYQMLDHFLNKPIGISLLLPNTFYAEVDGRNVVIETPLSAATAMAEMLVQSWGDVIRVFPAIPADWETCAFHDLRAEGAFVVSAQRKEGATRWVSIHSEKGLPCCVYLPGWKAVHQISKGKTIPVQSLGNDIYQLKLEAGETVVLAPEPSTDYTLELVNASNESDRNFYGVKFNQGLPYVMALPE